MKKLMMCLCVMMAALTGCLLENGKVVDETTDAGVDASESKCTVTIRATDGIANENGDTATVQFERSNCSLDKQLEVKFDLSGTASSSDYVGLSDWYVLIPAGQTEATIVVTAVNDTIVEDPESLIFTIRPESHLIVGTPNTATVTINDNDVVAHGLPDFTVTASQPSVNSGQCTQVTLDVRTDVTSCTSFGGNADWAGLTVTTDTVRNVCPTGTGTTYGWRCVGPGGTRDQSVTVNVNSVGSPTVTLSSNGTSFVYPSTIELDAAVSYSGTVGRVEFRDGTLVICTDSTAPYHCTWTTAGVGAHQVTAVAYPVSGNSATSNELAIGVYQSSSEVPCHGLGLYFSNAQQPLITRCTKWDKMGHGLEIAKSTFVDGGVGACAITCYDNTGNTVLPQAVTGVWMQNGTSDVTRWYTTGCARLPWHPASEPDQAGGAWDKLCDRTVTSLSGPPTP